MARQYDVKGTSSFLIWSIGLALLCAWALKDGWFPSEGVINKHGVPGESQDHFYTFNRSLAYLSGVGSIVCAFVHKFVR